MNFYFEAAKTLERLDAKQGSIKGILGTLPDKDRKRTAALVIETLKCKSTVCVICNNTLFNSTQPTDKSVLIDIIKVANLMEEERKKVTSLNLALVLVHDLLLSPGGIQAGDGPIKQAILRHKTRLNGELIKIKTKRGIKSNLELATQAGDQRAGMRRSLPRCCMGLQFCSADSTLCSCQHSSLDD